MTLDYEYFEKQEDVRKHIQECEGHHMQQVAYSSYHDALTQICYHCGVIRSNILKVENKDMTDDYIKKLVNLAKEIHEMQLKESNLHAGKQIATDMETIRLNSKINYLIGYIMALEQPT